MVWSCRRTGPDTGQSGSMLKAHHKLALFMEGALGLSEGKMGYGLLRYSHNEIIAVIDSAHAGLNQKAITGINRDVLVVATIEEALARGANTLVLSIAPSGGRIPEDWLAKIDQAHDLGMNLVNGLHDRLELRYTSSKPGQWVWDVRVEPEDISTGKGYAAHLENRRVLMIGTDMAVGKMTAGLELLEAARKRGINSGFVATGQIGIVITGEGVPLDAIRLDYAPGAVEREVLRHRDQELVIIEGQGALNHPGSSASLPLLRGSMPSHMVLCHRAHQETLFRLPEYPIPPLPELIQRWEDLASMNGLFPRAKVAAIALNTQDLDAAESLKEMEELQTELKLPVGDFVRFGADAALESILAD